MQDLPAKASSHDFRSPARRSHLPHTGWHATPPCLPAAPPCLPTAPLLTRGLPTPQAPPEGPGQAENNFSLFDFSLTVLQGKLQN